MAVEPLRLSTEMRSTTMEIAEFVYTEKFRALISELNSKPVSERYDFVRNVVINKGELATRGISVPEGMTIQRSVFADGRPTLFCVTKYLSDRRYKVTITFDNPDEDESKTPDPRAKHLFNEGRQVRSMG